MATGITLGIDLPGLVPPYEEYAAMVNAHYNRQDWLSLGPDDRAQAVAFYRLSRLVSLHEADAAALAAHKAAANDR